MKQLKYSIMILFAAVVFSACNSEDLPYDIKYTPIHPLGGQYTVTVSANGQKVVQTFCYIANTAANDADSCWVRIGEYSSASVYSINGKVGCSPANLSFTGSNVKNLAGNVVTSTNTFSIPDGKLALKGIKAPSGTIADKISFTYTTTKSPGVTYSVEGWRFTAWQEDDPKK